MSGYRVRYPAYVDAVRSAFDGSRIADAYRRSTAARFRRVSDRRCT